MRAPRGSATTILSLAAGLVVAVAVAASWVPMARESGRRDARALSTQLEIVAVLGSADMVGYAQLAEHPAASPAKGGEVRGALQGLLESLAGLGDVDAVALTTPSGGIIEVSPREASAVAQRAREACSGGGLREGLVVVTDVLSVPDSAPVQAVCAPVFDKDRALEGVLVTIGGADYQARLERERRRALTLLAVLGSTGSLIVVLGMSWLLAPLRATARAAGRIAKGEVGVRVATDGPEEIAQLGEAVNTLARSIETRTDEIEDRMRVVSELSGMVAHEVRNPLQSLSLLCTLARTEPDAETRNKLLLNVEEEIRVLEGVVKRFLRSSGPLQISRARSDVVEVMDRAASVAEPQARNKGVKLQVQAPPRMVFEFDGSLVRRALENLLLNATEFAALDAPGQVTATVLKRGNNAVLVVDDSGPGVPADSRERIFQPYYSTKGGGTGLGLALVKQVFEAHGGYIRCDDSPLGGARFIASFPLAPPTGGPP